MWNIIDNWVDEETNDREPLPSPNSDVEHAAVKHVEIRRVVANEYSGAQCPVITEEKMMRDKAEAKVCAAQKNDIIQVRRIDDAPDEWSNAIKLECGNWLVVDGREGFKVASDDLLGEHWAVNAEGMKVEDNMDNPKERQSKYQKSREKEELLIRMAKLGGAEERKKEIERRFHHFNNLPNNERTFHEFQNQLLKYVESPSDHTITVKLDGENHIMDCVLYEHGSAAMRQLVTRCVLQQLIQASEDCKKLTSREKKQKRQKGRVGQVCKKWS